MRKLTIFAVFAVIACLALPAQAQDDQWIAPGDDDYDPGLEVIKANIVVAEATLDNLRRIKVLEAQNLPNLAKANNIYDIPEPVPLNPDQPRATVIPVPAMQPPSAQPIQTVSFDLDPRGHLIMFNDNLYADMTDVWMLWRDLNAVLLQRQANAARAAQK